MGGKMTKLMDLENILTQMVLNMKVTTNLVKKTVSVNSFGLIDHLMKVILSIIISMVMESINGPMVENLLEIGSAIRCMDLESLLGMTVGNTKVSTMMTKNTDMEFLRGQMDDNTMEPG